jgi:hypothetical protein
MGCSLGAATKGIHMPILPCPDCGREVSAEAADCPHCGRQMVTGFRRILKGWSRPRTYKALGLVLVIFGAFMFFASTIAGIFLVVGGFLFFLGGRFV